MKDALIILGMIYSIAFIAFASIIALDHYEYQCGEANKASPPLKRIEYIMPARPDGCWLGQVPR